MDKLERLLNLTAALLEAERPLSAEDLRERVPGYPEVRESFRRQFERDKDDLREMGIPLRVVPVPGSVPAIDGYEVRKDDYYLRDPGLTAAELAALHLASSLVHLDGLQGLGGLWKLGGAVETNVPSNVGAAVEPLPANPDLVTLWGAVTERRVATFTYRDTEREIHPYRLDYQNGHWYVSGFDRVRSEERVYRLDRVAGPVRLIGGKEAFVRPTGAVPGLSLEPWQIGDGEPVHARLWVDATQAAVASHQVGSSAVEETRPDGSVVLGLDVTNIHGFRAFVLGFLDHAEVLSPEPFRCDIVAWLEAQLGPADRAESPR